MTPVAIILYEDQRGPVTGFGLHTLVLACIADDLNVERYALEKIVEGRPMKGVSKILQSCYREVRRIASRGQRVFALIDNDHVRDHLPGLDARADEPSVVCAIKDKSDAPTQLEVVLLDKNTETVLEAARLCDPALPDDAIREALRKHPEQRDRIFHHLARGSRSVRTCIRTKIPALERLVQHLAPLAREVVAKPAV